MNLNNDKVVVSVLVQGETTVTSNVELRELYDLRDSGSPKVNDDWPQVRVVTPTRIVEVRSHERSRSLGRTFSHHPWTRTERRGESTSGGRGRSRVFAAEAIAGCLAAREPASSRSSSRPLTPLDDGPPPHLPPTPRAGEPDASSVTSAPAELAGGPAPAEPTAPGADSHESLLRRFRLADTLIGRIAEQPETRESLVTRLMGVSLFVLQPVYLSHRFQDYDGEKLMVLDQDGNPLLFAVETDRSAVRRACCCCCPAHRRPFQMMLYDMEERPVALFSRRLACVSCWSPCCLQRAHLRDVIRTQEEKQDAAPAAASEIFYGVIKQRWHPTRAEFVCKGIRGGVVLRVRGPARRGCGCGAGAGSGAAFHILSMHGRARLGSVRPRWTPLDVDVYRRSDNYGVRFDRALPSRAKITLLGAAVLLDVLFFNV